MTQTNRLVTIVFSHYNEKARWALDWCGVDYEERAYMPGFSHVAVFAATRGRGGKADKVSSRWSTPILVTREGEALCDSTDIVRWASARAGTGGDGPLFPVPEVLELVETLGRQLGPHTRLAAYFHALRVDSMLASLGDANVSKRQALAFRVVAPLGKQLVRRGLGVTAERYVRSLERIRTSIADAERRLERSEYLVGDRFTAADLTFASLLAPVLLVTREEGYSAALPELGALDADGRALVAEMRATRAGAFALETFRRHRHERVQSV